MEQLFKYLWWQRLILEWEKRDFRHHGIQSPYFVFILLNSTFLMSNVDLTERISQEQTGEMEEGLVYILFSIHRWMSSLLSLPISSADCPLEVSPVTFSLIKSLFCRATLPGAQPLQTCFSRSRPLANKGPTLYPRAMEAQYLGPTIL